MVICGQQYCIYSSMTNSIPIFGKIKRKTLKLWLIDATEIAFMSILLNSAVDTDSIAYDVNFLMWRHIFWGTSDNLNWWSLSAFKDMYQRMMINGKIRMAATPVTKSLKLLKFLR